MSFLIAAQLLQLLSQQGALEFFFKDLWLLYTSAQEVNKISDLRENLRWQALNTLENELSVSLFGHHEVPPLVGPRICFCKAV
jgi:hypothetical protein